MGLSDTHQRVIRSADARSAGASGVAVLCNCATLSICAVCYLLFTRQWVAAGALAAYTLFINLSFHIGRQNVKRLIDNGYPMISPLEGNALMFPLVLLACLFLALAMSTHGWLSAVFWGFAGLASVHLRGVYKFRMAPRWAQIHYPLMIRYARCAALESNEAEKEQREYDLKNATKFLLKSVYPDRNDGAIENILESVSQKFETFSDRDLLIRRMRRRNATISQPELDDFLGKIAAHLQTDQGKRLIPRYAIAEVVESVFGEDERGDYLIAVIEGKAR